MTRSWSGAIGGAGDGCAAAPEPDRGSLGGRGDGAGLGRRLPREHGHDGRAARHRTRSRAGHGRPAVAGQRLPASAQRADPAGRVARRPVRPAPGVRRRTDRVRDRLRALHGRAGLSDTAGRAGCCRGSSVRCWCPTASPSSTRCSPRRTGAPRSDSGPAWSGVSTALGPLVGGWLVDALSWRWVFACVVPFALAAAWIAARRMPADEPSGAGPGGLRRGGAGHLGTGGRHGRARGGPEPGTDGEAAGRRRGPGLPGRRSFWSSAGSTIRCCRWISFAPGSSRAPTWSPCWCTRRSAASSSSSFSCCRTPWGTAPWPPGPPSCRSTCSCS